MDTKILIVDDMKNMRSFIKTCLRALGFNGTLVEAEGGIHALKIIAENENSGSPFQLLLVDWNMPDLTGIEVLKKIRANPQWKDLPFLLITAEGQMEHVVQAAKAGVSHYIMKPFTPDTLREKLEAVWKKHSG